LSLKLEAKTGFESAFGYQPNGVWSSPGRVNLIGEHTDYNQGFVLPFGIDLRTYAAISLRADRICRVASTIDAQVYEFDLDGSKPTGLDWALYPLGIAWMMREHGQRGFDCFITSDVPVGSGLSSSAALECSVSFGLNELWEAGLERVELAQIGQRAENEVVGAPTGIMDQTASLMAQTDSAVLIDCRDLTTTPIKLGLSEKDLVVAVIDTGVAHRHSDGGYRARRDACELGAKTLGVSSLRELELSDLPKAKAELDDLTFRRVRHVVTENQRVLDTVSALAASDLESLGPLMAHSHASMRDDFEISIDELDLAVATAIESGAIGSRMTGGGFGGAAIAIIDQAKLVTLEKNCKLAFATRGYKKPGIFAVKPSEGARKES
jgi:galactokinase